MQQSFSLVNDDDSSEELEIDEQILRKYGRKHDKPEDLRKSAQAEALSASLVRQLSKSDTVGPRPLSSDSEDDIIETVNNQESIPIIPGEYDAKQYEHLECTNDMKEIFQYITKYIPQPMSLDHRFKPFVPEYLPGVGDIDAFLKVLPPKSILDDYEIATNSGLGLVVLDEPAANQSDPALLHLQLRAESVKTTLDSHVVVKTVSEVEKNPKVVEKWIKDVATLHKSKSAPAVRYAENMPDLDDLMQEWPDTANDDLKIGKFPRPTAGQHLEEYVDLICQIIGIPCEKNKIHSLHVFFSLYAAVKSAQLFKSAQFSKNIQVLNVDNGDTEVDRLLLE